MNNEDLESDILNLKIQAIALLLVTFSYLIFFYVIIEEIKLKKNEDYDPMKWERLKRLTIFAAMIVLLVSLYYVYKAYVSWRKNPTSYNKNFLIASILFAIGAYIRFNTFKDTDAFDILHAQNF